MKKLFLALLCTSIGFTALAETKSTENIKDEKATAVATKTVFLDINSETEATTALRRQFSFDFNDNCGRTIRVYVSGPASADAQAFFNKALSHFMAHENSVGCYVF